MAIRVVRVSDTAFKFESDELDPSEARKLDVTLAEAGFEIERVKDPQEIGKGAAPEKKVLDDFYGD